MYKLHLILAIKPRKVYFIFLSKARLYVQVKKNMLLIKHKLIKFREKFCYSLFIKKIYIIHRAINRCVPSVITLLFQIT